MEGFLKEGGDLLFHIDAVSSAQSGLTSLFGMERGEPRRCNHLSFSVPAKAEISMESSLPVQGKDPRICEDKYLNIKEKGIRNPSNLYCHLKIKELLSLLAEGEACT